MLLEREHDLKLLSAALGEAAAGQGRIALVTGEAGIGKTSFVEHFIAAQAKAARVLKGHCDSLFTPTPLGPLYDIAGQIGGRLAAQLENEAPRASLFATLLDQLREPARPTILLIEDLHWADEATIDLVRFLCRRVPQIAVLVLLTYREDEVARSHPLRLLLGDLAGSKATLRLPLSRLTVEAVRALVAGGPIDATALHRQTAGNPFFVTEVLASAAPGIPPTVRDAVLARAARLGPAGRNLLEAAAVIGARVDLRLLERVVGDTAEGLADCIAEGMLDASGDAVAFRHELARGAIAADLAPPRRRQLSRRVFEALRAGGTRRVDLAQLAEHADGAGDAAAVFEYGVAAARAAAAVGAHRQAMAQYQRVLRHAGDRPAAVRLDLLSAYAEECSVVDELAPSARARQEAIALAEATGDRAKQGANLAALAWALVRHGENAAAEEASQRAIEVLRPMPPTRELANAYRVQAHLRMLNRDRADAVRVGRKAIALAERLEDTETVAAAEMVVGCALLVAGDDKGRAHMDRSLALAGAAGLDSLVALNHSNLGACYGEQYRFDEAERHLTNGIAYARERDLDTTSHYMSSWLALTRMYQGRWSEAGELANALVERPHVAAISRIMALVALGRVRSRRGDPGAQAALDEALELASRTETVQRLAPVRAARAEAAWLAGDASGAAAEAEAVHALAVKHRLRWHIGELSYWRKLGGPSLAPPALAAPPFLAQIRGDWRRAAGLWQRLGCPYEQARALADGDTQAQMAALEIFTRLGAAPAAAALRQRMREGGVRRIPRGPRASTRQNPFGLTAREMQILGHLAGGLSNARIGSRLHVSTKTVDHHVSAVLAKLGAATRLEAAQIARDRGLLGQNGEAARPK